MAVTELANKETSEASTCPLLNVKPLVSSAGSPWMGLHLECYSAGENIDRQGVVLTDHLLIAQLTESSDLAFSDGGPFSEFPLRAGQAILLPALMPFSLRLRAAGDFLVLQLDPKFIRLTLSNFLENARPVQLVPLLGISDPLLQALMVSLKEEAEARFPGGAPYGQSLVTALASCLARSCSGNPASAKSASSRRGLNARQLEAVLNYVQSHLDGDTSLKTIAAQASLSPFHFSRLFKQSTGLSPHQFVLQCRVERARELLLTTQHSAASISVMVGFCDQSHFVYHFKRYYGVTPKKLRQKGGAVALRSP